MGKAPCESLCFFRHTCKSSRENRNRNKSSLSSLTCHQERCGKNWLCANNRSWVIRSSMLCYLGQSKTALWDNNDENTYGNYISRDCMVCICFTQTNDIQEFPCRMSKDQKKIVFCNYVCGRYVKPSSFSQIFVQRPKPNML